MNLPKWSTCYAVVVTIALIFCVVEFVKYERTIEELTNGSDNNNKIVETLKTEKQELENRIKDLETEKEYLERKVAVLSEETENEIIDQLEKEIDSLNIQIAELKEDNNYFINEYNQLVLDIVEILSMNPDIFEKDNKGLLNPQYALYAIDSYVGRAFELSEIQRKLFEATGIHEPLEAIDQLLNLQTNVE